MRLIPLLLVVLLSSCATPAPSGGGSGSPADAPAAAGGRLLQSVPSPDGSRVLEERDAGEVGDFAWHRVTVRQGGKAQPVGSFLSVEDVRWSSDSSRVDFRARRAADYNLIEIVEVSHDLASGRSTTRVTGRENLEN